MNATRITIAALLVATSLPAQSVVGKYSTKNPQGNTVALIFEADGPTKVKGSLSANGVVFALAGEQRGGDVAGTMTGNGGNAVFEAHREGTQLRMILVEVGPNGQPNYQTAREVMFAVDNSAVVAAGTPAPASSPATPSAPGGSADDQKMRDLFTSTAWCTFSFSGGSTYNGGSYGSSGKTRTVFRPDGTVTQTGGSENTNSGAAGNVYGSSSNAINAFWRFENGQLAVSGDRTNWKPVRLQMTYNSNGAPIPKLDGVEHMRCQ